MPNPRAPAVNRARNIHDSGRMTYRQYLGDRPDGSGHSSVVDIAAETFGLNTRRDTLRVAFFLRKKRAALSLNAG